MKEHKFYKSERLCKKLDFDELFKDSESFFIYPFKVVYKIVDFKQDEYLKIGISVSKRNFKRAVKRNFIKRRIREAFRLNKQTLKESLLNKNIGLHLMFVYVSKDLMEYNEIKPKICLILEKINRTIEKNADFHLNNSN